MADFIGGSREHKKTSWRKVVMLRRWQKRSVCAPENIVYLVGMHG